MDIAGVIETMADGKWMNFYLLLIFLLSLLHAIFLILGYELPCSVMLPFSKRKEETENQATTTAEDNV